MWHENSIYPRIETGYVFTEEMNDELVEKFINNKFYQGLKSKKFNRSTSSC